MSESRSRIGILGAGHLGRIHLQQALAIPELEVIGFHDPDPARCVAVQAELGVPALGSVEAVIRAADLVDVVTPTLNHHACAMQAMEHGRHVFIEKPLANTLEEGRELVRTAERLGLCVQVGHVERFTPAFQAAVPSLRAPLFIEAHRLAQFNPRGTDVPVVVQDYPLTLGVVMAPGVLRRIFTENPSAVMLKHEDWPGLDKIGALRRWQAEGVLRPLSILCGNGGLFLDFEMVRGADGAMTGYAFPDMLVDLVRLHAAGDRTGAQDLFDAHLPLLRYEQQLGLGLAVRKHVLMRRGVIAHEGQRKPGAALNAAGRADVEFLLGRLARHDPRAALGPA